MSKPEEKEAKKSRLILFIGNLPYDTTQEALLEHFKSCDPSSVRLLTDKKTQKPKGFAFVEFSNLDGYLKALKYHRTVFMKRMINVEKTAGGGGSKSEIRKKRIQDKNEELRKEREKEKTKKPEKPVKEEKPKKKKPKTTGGNSVAVGVKS